MVGLVVGAAAVLGLMFAFGAGKHVGWAHAHHHGGFGRGWHGGHHGHGRHGRHGRGCGHRGHGHGTRGAYEGGPDGWDGDDDGDFERVRRPFRGGFGGGWARGLDLDDDQRDVVQAAMRDARRAGDALLRSLRETRGDAAEALRGDTIDQGKLDAVFATQDAAVAAARRDLVAAIGRAHAVLDAEQRARVADWLSSWR